MKQTTDYTEYHPRWYRTRVSTYWWTSQWSFFKFIVRELTSVFVAYFVILTLLMLRALSRGPEAYAQFQEWLRWPPVIALNVIAFLLVLFHTITWFNLAPKATPVRVRGKRVPDLMIALPNYVAWIAVSAVLVWLIIGR